MELQTIKLVSISDILLDQENMRGAPTDNQQNAIRQMIDEQKVELLNLAEHILNNGLNPGEPLWVVKSQEHKDKYIVAEGNRRITALKLLTVPSHASHMPWYSRMKVLSQQFLALGDDKVQAIEYASMENARKWVAVRHMGTEKPGVAFKRWGNLEKARSRVIINHEDPTTSLLLIDFYKGYSPDSDMVIQEIEERATTFERLIDSRHLWELLGIKIINSERRIECEDGDTDKGKKVLFELLKLMASYKRELINEIEDSTRQKKFITDFISSKNLTSKLQEDKTNNNNTSNEDDGSAQANNQERPTSTHENKEQNNDQSGNSEYQSTDSIKSRTKLASQQGHEKLKITNIRLKQFYEELQKVNCNKYPTSASLMIRPFIEMSTEYVLTTLGVEPPNNRASWTDGFITFNVKVNTLIDYLDSKRQNRIFENARNGIGQDTAPIHHINNLNAFTHNSSIIPNCKDLFTIWDRWYAYLKEIYARC